MKNTLRLLVMLLTPTAAASAAIENWCTEAEQVGEVLPSQACAQYLDLQGQIGSIAAPCWELIPGDLPVENWLAERDRCESEAHLAVCGMPRCY